jgi:PAS domain S-box-containing protein
MDQLGGWQSIIFPEDRPGFLHWMKELMQNETSGNHTIRIKNKSGETRWVKVNARAIKISNDPLLYRMVGASQDISEARQAQERLTDSEKQLALAIHSVKAGTWMWDIKTNKISWDERSQEMFGCDPDHIPQSFEAFLKHVHPDDRQLVREKNLRSLEQAEHYDCEYRTNPKDGKLRYVNAQGIILLDNQGTPSTMAGVHIDITDRIEAQQELQQREAMLQSIFRVAPTGIGVVRNRVLLEVNEKICEMTGYSRDELLGKNAMILYPTIEDYEYVGNEKYRQIALYGTGTVETKWKRKDGRIFDVLLSSTPMDPKDQEVGVTFTALDITDTKAAHAALQTSEARLKNIIDAAPYGAHTYTLDDNDRLIFNGANKSADRILKTDLQQHIGKELKEVFPDLQNTPIVDIYRRVAKDGDTVDIDEFDYEAREFAGEYEIAVCQTGPRQVTAFFRDIAERKKALDDLEASRARFRNLADNAPVGIYEVDERGDVYVNERWLQIHGLDRSNYDPKKWPGMIHPQDRKQVVAEWNMAFATGVEFHREYRIITPAGKLVWVIDRSIPVSTSGVYKKHHLGTMLDITERKLTEERFRRLAENVPVGIYEVDSKSKNIYCNNRLAEIVGTTIDEWKAELWYDNVHPEDRKRVKERWDECFKQGIPYQDEYRLKYGSKLIWVFDRAVPFTTNEERSHYLGVVTDITEVKRVEEKLRGSYEEVQVAVRRLTALRNIDTAITGSIPMRDVVKEILPNIVDSLGVDAAAILLPHLDGKNLMMVAHKGLPGGKGPGDTQSDKLINLSNQYAGKAYRERKVIFTPILSDGEEDNSPNSRFKEKFSSYAAAPLVVKNEVKGVLEVFCKRSIPFDQGWKDFMHSLTMQTAIAIDNADMFNRMQRTNLELLAAYEATIEGWSRALELRDKETLGHSERVIDLTLRLSSEMGIPQTEWSQIRRGVFLHDIGKMGIPDSILLKPGPLSDDEWVIMRQHPRYAYEMLSGIPYLLPALDIPYCHHERWDGSGYPRGLKAEEIPLAARIFAVIDVWDALTSRRPYRPAWPEENAYKYLAENAGKSFDDRVVKVFLKMMSYTNK